jgi:hypothetical protein
MNVNEVFAVHPPLPSSGREHVIAPWWSTSSSADQACAMVGQVIEDLTANRDYHLWPAWPCAVHPKDQADMASIRPFVEARMLIAQAWAALHRSDRSDVSTAAHLDDCAASYWSVACVGLGSAYPAFAEWCRSCVGAAAGPVEAS